jgi:hypothetical protein
LVIKNDFLLSKSGEKGKKMTRKLLAWGVMVSLILVFGFSLSSAKDVPRMTVDELKERLGNPDVVIIDVRTDRDWDKSSQKITGAVREDPHETASWAKKYSPEKTLVLYCA